MDYDSIETCECKRPILGTNECWHCGITLCDWCGHFCRACWSGNRRGGFAECEPPLMASADCGTEEA